MDKFVCIKCGACCRNLEKSIYFGELDKGNGICKHLDEQTNLCTIYDNRPLLCNIDKAYEEYFTTIMSRDKYYAANAQSCEKLRNLKMN